MQAIINWVETLDQKFQYIKYILIFNILALDLENKHYDFELFMKHLENPIAIVQSYNKEYNINIAKRL